MPEDLAQTTNNQSNSHADALIQERQSATQQKFKRIGLVAAGVLAAVVLVYAGNSFITNSSAELDPNDAKTVSTDSKPTGQTISTPSDQAAISESARQVFIERYGEFEQTYKPILQNPLIQRFDDKRSKALLQAEEQALSSFASAAFQTASEQVNQLIDNTFQLKLDWQKAHSQALAEANAYYFEGKINRARLAYQRAIDINPNHDENQLAKRRIDSFQRLNSLEQALAVARVENNLERQLTLLEELMALPDQMSVYQPDYDAVSTQLDERKLSALLLKAKAELDSSNMDSVTRLIVQAKNIDANAAAISQLEQRLNRMRKQQSRDAWVTQLERLVADDNWQRVIVDAKTASAQFPEESRFQALGEVAEQILSTQRRVNLFLRQPQRLADSGLRQQAQITLKNALSLSLQSPSLAKGIKQLASYVDVYQQKIPVTIESDGQSNIQVVGVGQVGTTLSKDIELTPGTYTIEAKRTGYKSVRKTISVSQDTPNTIFIATTDKI